MALTDFVNIARHRTASNNCLRICTENSPKRRLQVCFLSRYIMDEAPAASLEILVYVVAYVVETEAEEAGR